MVVGRFCKTAVFLALILGYRHILHQYNACNLLSHISKCLDIYTVLEILILFDFFFSLLFFGQKYLA